MSDQPRVDLLEGDAPVAVDAGAPLDVPAAPHDAGAPLDAPDVLLDAGAPLDAPDVLHDAGAPLDALHDVSVPPVDVGGGADAGCSDGGCVTAPTTRYRVLRDPPEVAYVDVCGTAGATRVLTLQDDARVRVSLPFAFRYWSTDFAVGSPLNVTTNGWVSLSATTSFLRSSSIPATLEPNATLAPYWRDIQVRGDGVCVTTLGASPARRFAVEWKNALDVNNANTQFTFELVLHETTHVIDFAYRTMTNAPSATVGVERPDGAEAASHCAADAGTWCRPVAGSRFRYLPIP